MDRLDDRLNTKKKVVVTKKSKKAQAREAPATPGSRRRLTEKEEDERIMQEGLGNIYIKHNITYSTYIYIYIYYLLAFLFK